MNTLRTVEGVGKQAFSYNVSTDVDCYLINGWQLVIFMKIKMHTASDPEIPT